MHAVIRRKMHLLSCSVRFNEPKIYYREHMNVFLVGVDLFLIETVDGSCVSFISAQLMAGTSAQEPVHHKNFGVYAGDEAKMQLQAGMDPSNIEQH